MCSTLVVLISSCGVIYAHRWTQCVSLIYFRSSNFSSLRLSKGGFFSLFVDSKNKVAVCLPDFLMKTGTLQWYLLQMIYLVVVFYTRWPSSNDEFTILGRVPSAGFSCYKMDPNHRTELSMKGIYNSYPSNITESDDPPSTQAWCGVPRVVRSKIWVKVQIGKVSIEYILWGIRKAWQWFCDCQLPVLFMVCVDYRYFSVLTIRSWVSWWNNTLPQSHSA